MSHSNNFLFSFVFQLNILSCIAKWKKSLCILSAPGILQKILVAFWLCYLRNLGNYQGNSHGNYLPIFLTLYIWEQCTTHNKTNGYGYFRKYMFPHPLTESSIKRKAENSYAVYGELAKSIMTTKVSKQLQFTTKTTLQRNYLLLYKRLPLKIPKWLRGCHAKLWDRAFKHREN